jgi:hypothetical protein
VDEHERRHKPRRPLLPFLERLNRELPKKWDRKQRQFVPDDDWLLWDFKRGKKRGEHLRGVRR